MTDNKFIIKAYDYDGQFYGYFAAHPDDPENKSFSFYEDDKAKAKQFDTYMEASNMIERFQDGSDLEYQIETTGNNCEQLIYDWVKENYGEAEANNPSWNISALAAYITANL